MSGEPMIDPAVDNPETVDGGWWAYRCQICPGETLLQGGWDWVLKHFRKIHPDLDAPKKPTERMLASPIRTTLRVIPAHYSFPRRARSGAGGAADAVDPENLMMAENVLPFRPRRLPRARRVSVPVIRDQAATRPLTDFTEQGTLFDLDDDTGA